jgi:alpha-L-fucosidase
MTLQNIFSKLFISVRLLFVKFLILLLEQKMKCIALIITLILLLCITCNTTPTTTNSIKQYQSWKFGAYNIESRFTYSYLVGLFIHWGIYSQLNLNYKVSDICSWPLCWSTRSWSNPAISSKQQMTQFRERYWNISKQFNPSSFDPELWADLAYDAGFKYIVMTTKHHDGFNMYNTTLDPFSVTGKECPFQRDAFGEVVTAFRKKGMGIGAYFSKSDWHRSDFWNPNTFADTYAPNYEPSKDTKQWNSFTAYARGQLAEIMEQYNPDILWLDAGFMVAPALDIGMSQVVSHARSVNPDVIVVDRGGRVYEQVVTPEQSGIPAGPLQQPWELCQSMGDQWGYIKNDIYKSTKDLITTLLQTVSRGGNYLLDIGPDSNGVLPPMAVSRLKEIGEWMKVNGEGIHDTIPIEPYYVISTYSMNCLDCFHYMLTRRDNVVYVYLNGDTIPRPLVMSFVTRNAIGSNTVFRTDSIQLLGTDLIVKPNYTKEGFLVLDLSSDIKPPAKYAFGFKLISNPTEHNDPFTCTGIDQCSRS